MSAVYSIRFVRNHQYYKSMILNDHKTYHGNMEYLMCFLLLKRMNIDQANEQSGSTKEHAPKATKSFIVRTAARGRVASPTIS